jgi:MoxR-like ATPase
MATQNPIEYEGTFPLPEAQLDRFLLKIQLGYPSPADEIKVLENQQIQHPIEKLTPVITQETLAECQATVKQVFLSDSVKQYIIDLINATRKHEDIYLGASPRGSIGLFKTSQAKAALDGRDYVIPDDIKSLFLSVVSHRIVVSPKGRITHLTPEQILEEILYSIPVPGDVSYQRNQ